MTADDVRRLLQQRIKEAGSQFKFCVEVGVHPSTLNKFLHHTLRPTPAIINSLGLREIVTYEPVKK